MEIPETKTKKWEEIIDILVGEVKRLKTELAKYELIKQEVKEEEIKTKKTDQCWVCGLKSNKLFERNRGKSSSYLCCADCYKDIEKDTKKVQDRERETLTQNPIETEKTVKIKKRKRTRKGIGKQEAMKHSKPSKKKNKVICEDCGGEYLTVNFHSHYAKHIK